MWLLALAVNVCLFVFASLLKRRFAQADKAPASAMMAIAYLVGVMPISIFVGLLLPHDVQWSSWVWFLLIAEGLAIALLNLLSFMAYKLLPAALFQTIFQLRLVAAIGLGWGLLHEKLTSLQILGTVFILASGILAIWAPARSHRNGTKKYEHLAKGVLLAVGSALSLGTGVVIEKAALQYMDLGAYFIVGFGTQAAWLVLFAAFDYKKVRAARVSREAVRQSVILGLLSAGTGFSYLVALKAADNISLVQALASIVVPLTAIAAHVFLHEKDDSRLLWTAIVLGVIGLVITAL